MSVLLRVLLISSAICVLVFMLKKIRQSKLKIEYTIFWILFSFLLVIMGIFPQLFYRISSFIGFQSPISMVFLSVIFVLIIKMFFMTIQISQLENKVDSLVQQVAIDRKNEEDRKVILSENRGKEPIRH